MGNVNDLPKPPTPEECEAIRERGQNFDRGGQGHMPSTGNYESGDPTKPAPAGAGWIDARQQPPKPGDNAPKPELKIGSRVKLTPAAYATRVAHKCGLPRDFIPFLQTCVEIGDRVEELEERIKVLEEVAKHIDCGAQ